MRGSGIGASSVDSCIAKSEESALSKFVQLLHYDLPHLFVFGAGLLCIKLQPIRSKIVHFAERPVSTTTGSILVP